MVKPVIGIELTGTRQLQNKLARLGSTKAKAIIRSALSKAITPAVKAVKAEAPRASGALRRSIGRKVKQRGKAGYALAGPRKGYVEQVNRPMFGRGLVPVLAKPVRYAHLAERPKGGEFVRRALAQTKAESQRLMAQAVKEGIARAAK